MLIHASDAPTDRTDHLPRDVEHTKAVRQVRVCRAAEQQLGKAGMTVLLGGLRVLGSNVGEAKHGVFTNRVGTQTNDVFVNLLGMGRVWAPASEPAELFQGRDRSSGALKWTGTRVDLVFGQNSVLRALAEVHACDGSEEAFVHDFVWPGRR